MTDTSSVQQLRDHVLQLARDIEALSQSHIPPERFFPEFLEQLVSATGARAGALFLRDNMGALRIAHNVRFAQIGIADTAANQRLNERLLQDVLATGQASIYTSDEKRELPSHHVIIMAALQAGTEPVGAVELFQRPDSPPESRAGYLQFVEQMCGYASQYLARQRQPAQVETATRFWERFEQFALAMQRAVGIKETSTVAVNDGRLLLRADRLSLAVRRGKKTSITAISAQESVNARANLVRSMASLADAAMELGETVQFTGKIEHLPQQIEKPLAAFVQESGSRMVMVVPLRESGPLIASDDEGKSKELAPRSRVVGALVIEQVASSQPAPELAERADLVADHTGAALTKALDYQRVFLLPLWRAVGQTTEWFHGRKLAKLVAIVGGAVAVGLVLTLVPWDYRVEGEGRLMPVEQHDVFAPLDGEVVEIAVEGGQRVNAGDLVVQLRNDQLRADLLAARNEHGEKQQLVLSLREQIDNAERIDNKEEAIRLVGKQQETQIEIRGLEERIHVLEEREQLLSVKAPASGVVATFQPEQTLQNRPVRRGESLLEIMNDAGPWHLELEVEEQRMGHILLGQEKLGKKDLPVEFILATSAETTFRGALESIATRSATSQERGSIVEVVVATDVKQLPYPRIGAEVRAKIHCGKRALGYVLFGDVVEFVQRYFWL